MKNLVLGGVAVGLALGLSACSAGSGTDRDALPQSGPPAAVSQAPAKTASSCDVAREAILTGTPADIKGALRALQADKTADATAREYARYYLTRDAGDPQMREMDVSLIQSACAL